MDLQCEPIWRLKRVVTRWESKWSGNGEILVPRLELMKDGKHPRSAMLVFDLITGPHVQITAPPFIPGCDQEQRRAESDSILRFIKKTRPDLLGERGKNGLWRLGGVVVERPSPPQASPAPGRPGPTARKSSPRHPAATDVLEAMKTMRRPPYRWR